jgi:hypothetical protein
VIEILGVVNDSSDREPWVIEMLIIRNDSNFDHNLSISCKTSEFIPVLELKFKESILGDRGYE